MHIRPVRTSIAASLVLLSGVATVGATSEASLSGFPEVVDLQRISGESPLPTDCGDHETAILDSEVEVHLAVNPSDPDHLLAAWQQDRHTDGATRSNVVAVSSDGGSTWTGPITVDGISSCTDGDGDALHERVSDPWVAIGPDGMAYLSMITFTTEEGVDPDDAVRVSVSPDGGTNWHAEPSTLDAEEHFYLEKPQMSAHPRHPGTVYAVWTREEEVEAPLTGAQRVDAQMRFARSEDGGLTWSVPSLIPPDEPLEAEWPTDIAVIDQDGDTKLVVVYRVWDQLHRERGTPGAYRLFSVTLDDDEEGWSEPTPIATYVKSAFRGDKEEVVQFAHVMPDVAVGPDGELYVAWAEDTAAGTAPGGTEIRVARSDDAGESWSDPMTVTSLGDIAEVPAIAVAADGTVGVSWYDVRNDVPVDDELTTDVWFAASTDAGKSWREVHLGGPFDLRRAPRDSSGERHFLGDYTGLVGLPDGFGAAFAMAPPLAEHGPSDAFFARITLPTPGPVKVTGSGSVPGEDEQAAATFDLAVHSDGENGLKGHLVLDDPSAGVRIQATSLTTVLVQRTADGVRCTVRGHADVTRGGAVESEPFTATCLDVADRSAADVLRLETDSYSGGGELTSGNLTVHG